MIKAEYQLMRLVYSDAELIEELPIFSIENPFLDGSLNRLLELTKEELKRGRSPRTATAFAKKEFVRLGGLESTLKPMLDMKSYRENAEKYSAEVITAWEARILTMMVGGVSVDLESGLSTEDIIRKVESVLSDIDNSIDPEQDDSLESAKDALYEKWTAMALGDNSVMIPTYIEALDEIILGFQRGTHNLICARPSVGKTAAGLTLASNQDLEGIKTGVVSLEMMAPQCLERLAQVRSGVSARDIISGVASEDQRNAIAIEISKIVSDNTMQIKCTSDRKLNNVKRIIRKMQKTEPDLAIVYIDYIQLIDFGDRRLNSVQNIEECSKAITDLSKQLNISIVSMAQLNREGSEKPRMSNLKGASQLEQDGHIVILIDRDLGAQYNANATGDTESLACNFIVAKNRDGETGMANMAYNAKITKFFSGSDGYNQGGTINDREGRF